MLRLSFVTVLFAFAAAGPAAAQDGAFAPPPAKVEVASAELRNMAPVVDVTGTVVSLNDSRIAAEIEGVLTWLADVGAPAAAGDVIARIDPRLIRIDVARAEANVARLETDFDYRQRQLERTEDLAAKNSASKTLLDEARSLRDQAMHALADARAALQRARADLDRTQIRAPFAGHVVERLASAGEFVNVGEDVVRLVDTHRKEIAFPAPIALVQYIEPGLRVTVRAGTAANEHVVRTVVPVGDAVSRMVEVRLDASDSDWLVGTAVQASVPNSNAVSTVAVPRDALIRRDGRTYVYRVSADSTAEQIGVDVQTIVGLWVGVSNGVEAGDQIVVRGAERLAPGQAVEVIRTVSSR